MVFDISLKGQIAEENDKRGYGIKESLICMLVESCNILNSDFVDAFLLTFRNWMTTRELLQLLKSRYIGDIISPASGTNFSIQPSQSKQDTIKVKVVSVTKKLIERYYHDFTDNTNKECLFDLLNIIRGSKHKLFADNIALFLEKKLTRTALQLPIDLQILNQREIFLIARNFKIGSASSKYLGQQLTIIDLAIMRRLSLEEISSFLFGEKDRNYEKRTSQLEKYILKFNKIGLWVATVILSQECSRARSEAIGKFIEIANHCLHWKDFNTSMSILSGLNMTPISRLKTSWEKLSSKKQSTFEKLVDLFNPNGNFKNYRNALSNAKLPCIPFFGLFIKDLTFMRDGNPNALCSGKPNIEKLTLLASKILSFQDYQHSSYSFAEEATIKANDSLKHLHCLDEESLLEISKSLE